MRHPPELPEEVWIGKNEGEWPLVIMTTEATVIDWLSHTHEPGRTDRPYRRHVWKVKLDVQHEVELVTPDPYLAEVP